jgi:hypothetical protein
MALSGACGIIVLSYLYSGIIATHLHSQGLAAFLSSYNIIVIHLRPQGLAAH